jgi:TonB family protein
MKRILFLLLCSVVPVGGAVCQEPEAGIGPPPLRIFYSRYKGDGFSVLLPLDPSITTSKISRKDGKERTKRFLTVTMNSVVYSIEVLENLKPGQSLEEFIAESNASFQYDPATERNLTVNGFPGKEYSSQTETTTTAVQFLATEDRLFRFAATGPAAAAPVIKDFLASILVWDTGKTGGMDASKSFAGSNAGEKIYTGRDVDVKANLLKKPKPSYTEEARNYKVEGTVILRAVLSKTGRVENIRVVVGLPYGLNEQAIKTARKIRFVPATKEGKAVSMWIQLEYNFSLY